MATVHVLMSMRISKPRKNQRCPSMPHQDKFDITWPTGKYVQHP